MVCDIRALTCLRKAAYGNGHIKPKHHYCFHNAQQLELCAMSLDCFVHERKHQVLKQAADSMGEPRFEKKQP